MSEQRDNSGTLGRNQHKQNDKQPEFNGQCRIEGVEYWISGWVKEGKNGKFFSLAFKPKEEQPKRPSAPKGDISDLDSDIPFMRLTHEYHY